MKKGDIVTIYEDPITRKKEEGKAKLVEKLQNANYKHYPSFWSVRFKNGYICERWIKEN